MVVLSPAIVTAILVREYNFLKQMSMSEVRWNGKKRKDIAESMNEVIQKVIFFTQYVWLVVVTG